MLTVPLPGDAGDCQTAEMADERRPELRVADADRERTVLELGEHHSAGRITYEEFVERMDRAYEARTGEELVALTRDLPSTAAVRTPARPRKKKRWLVSVMSGSDRTEEVAPEHTVVLDLMGGSDLDLRHAEFPGGETTVTAIAIMGGSDIWVPDGARVEFSGFAFMGGNDNNVPPGGSRPLIRVRAWSLMGGIDVRSGERKRDKRRGLPPPPAPPPPP
jgi:hypothetical protein